MTNPAATPTTADDLDPRHHLGRYVDLAATMRRRPSAVVCGDELAWVTARVSEIADVVAPDTVVTACLTVNRRLAGQLSLQASRRAVDVGDPSWQRWIIDNVEYTLEIVSGSGDDLVNGQRFDAGVLLDSNIWFGPVPGIAYGGATDRAVHETRWVLEILDGADPSSADTAARLLR